MLSTMVRDTAVYGVPDSQLEPLCTYLMDKRGISRRHIIAANEGNAAALAAGYYLATGQVPVVYMQNSGIGNIVNPMTSLLHDKVYGIPCLFVVGWRGEPGVKDEPQHVYQGAISRELLELLDIETAVLSPGMTAQAVAEQMEEWVPRFAAGGSAAFLVRKGALAYSDRVDYSNRYCMTREYIVERIAAAAGEDLIVSTTGKASRELFEIRERGGQSHRTDFLTVGSMGHSSSIALGIALEKPKTRVWCLDGDGAALMHMGAMAVAGAMAPNNLVHVIVNNGAHETVGGMPTVAAKIDLPMIARGCGYAVVRCVETPEELTQALTAIKADRRLTMLEVKSAVGAREDLGRPTSTPADNKRAFMEYIKELM